MILICLITSDVHLDHLIKTVYQATEVEIYHLPLSIPFSSEATHYVKTTLKKKRLELNLMARNIKEYLGVCYKTTIVIHKYLGGDTLGYAHIIFKLSPTNFNNHQWIFPIVTITLVLQCLSFDFSP